MGFGAGFWVLGFGLLGLALKVLGFGLRFFGGWGLGFGFRVEKFFRFGDFRALWVLGLGLSVLASGLGFLGLGLIRLWDWGLELLGFRAQGFGV